MFNKNKEKIEIEGRLLTDKDGKLVNSDIGFIQECIGLCKNLVAIETHLSDSYISTKNELFLKWGKFVREKRTKYLKMIESNILGGQVHCINKHTCEIIMRIQELSTRCMCEEDINSAKFMLEDIEGFMNMFFELNGYNKDNVIFSKSEA
jgi:hypothetical protein